MENRDKPAYPSTYLNEKGNADYSEGISKREMIAAMALQGLLSCPYRATDIKVLSNEAVLMADALLTQLQKQ